MLTLHEDAKTLHQGTMDNRCFYLPLDPKTGAPRMLLLNGTWDFAYFDRYIDVPDAVDYHATIPVPSVWQQHGYDAHQYSNTKYVIPFDPPYAPIANPCGCYRRGFELSKKKGERYHLNFEGVDSCYYLYVNGKYAGFSQISHSTSEFDITALVKSGENTIEVRVLKWGFGTYMEDQDKLRQSGIFRDVYVLIRPDAHVRDFTVRTPLSGKRAAIELDVECAGAPDIRCHLCAPDGTRLAEAAVKDGKARFELDKPLLWTAETPHLYTLAIETDAERIEQKVGVREIAIVDGVVLLNGKKIKFRGVNRHDSDPFKGFAVSREDLLRDLLIMKAHNVNALRTSHYPNAPVMAQLCDELGLYMIAEADVETHGVLDVYSPPGTLGDPNALSEAHRVKYATIARDPMFHEAILDRVQHCVTRDKNSAAVVIWSMGNESGYGENFADAARWTKSYDPTRLVHYEGSHRAPAGMDHSPIELHSRMYPPLAQIHEYFKSGKDKRPYIMCEYIHAMGNGPGDAWDYQQLIDKYDGLCGGFVWEFCDHAIHMGKTVDGRDKFFYGGDFGEFPHDGNFCMDGLVYPDRRPHTGFLEYKNVIRPVRAALGKDGKLQLSNHLDFMDACDVATGRFELTQDGELVQCGEFELPSIPPHKAAAVDLPLKLPKDGKLLLRVSYLQKRDMPWARAGHELGFDQLVLRDGHVLPALKPARPAKLAVRETNTHIVVSAASMRYSFDKTLGCFDQLVFAGKALIEHPMEYNIWRAPIDNDMYIRKEWVEAGYDRAVARVYACSASEKDGAVAIAAQLSLAAPYRQRALTIDAVYTVHPDGRIDAALRCEKRAEMPPLPRFGLRLFLPQSMQQVEYFGYGPHESYLDKHRASWLGKFETTPQRNHEDYIRPQENGSHWGTEYVRVSDEFASLIASGEKPFSFNASPYTQEELTEKPHNFELDASGHTVLCLDYAQSGIGSNSCGPELLEQYHFNPDRFTLSLSLTPEEVR